MNQYPLWRYILMVAIIVLGVIYALPNLYGDDYAVQVTTKDATALQPQVEANIIASLTKANIPYISIKEQPNSYLIRFNENEEQTKAQDLIQATLGANYAVALNLAPRTPKWLQSLGAEPMKLGLDLRGGISFLLDVDVGSMLKDRINGDIHLMGEKMRDALIRYSGIMQSGDSSIVIRFRNTDDVQKATAIFQKNFSEYQFTSQGTNLTASLLPAEVIKLEQYAVSQNLVTLRNRVNELGVSEPVIQQQGPDRINVELPGIQDSARAKDIIGKVATLRFQLVDTQHSAADAARTGVIPFGSTLYKSDEGPVLLLNQVVLHGRSITNASSIMDDNGRPAVSVRASGPEVSTFTDITLNNVGKLMATIYVETIPEKTIVDGKVQVTYKQEAKIINIATIQSGLGANFQITGLPTPLAAQNLALQLRSGAYSARMSFVSERIIGPSLGKENIRTGVLSCIVGSVMVFVFMAFYYSVFGLIADFALVFNLILLIAIMSLMGFTLTLPGIAGIVLTVGMSVDANVLINERIREELRLGMSAQAAIYAGYERAFSTIVDANVTILIVAVVLFALGTGPVQGFAVTLSIGILISMVTAVFFTRAIVNLMYGRKQNKKLSVGIKYGIL